MSEEKAICLVGFASKRRTENRNLSYSLLLCYLDLNVVSGTVSCYAYLYGYEEPLKS